MRSNLEIYDLGTDHVETVLSVPFLIEAPNWMPDDGSLIVNGDGRLYRVPLDVPALNAIDTGGLSRINNDHGVAPDASLFAVSDSTDGGKSCIYTISVEGGRPRRITEAVPSWWHGWSPDGGQLAYTAVRNGEFCIAACATDGSGEAMVIGGPHHYDGPDYSPDGEWIWFNSDRGGNMQLWRVRPDGRDPQQMTDDASVNWFPHPSPDGRHVLFLAYAPGTAGHPSGRDVELRLLECATGLVRPLVALLGGQGTINVPCWSPDSQRFAFMRYEREDGWLEN